MAQHSTFPISAAVQILDRALQQQKDSTDCCGCAQCLFARATLCHAIKHLLRPEFGRKPASVRKARVYRSNRKTVANLWDV